MRCLVLLVQTFELLLVASEHGLRELLQELEDHQRVTLVLSQIVHEVRNSNKFNILSGGTSRACAASQRQASPPF